MPEGDAIHRAARRLQVLVGERIDAESPHPRAQAERIAERVDGHVLEAVEAVGKNLLLRFDSGLTVRSHLRMSGRWSVRPAGSQQNGRPWLVLRGTTREAVLWNGPVLDLHTRAIRALGPDILEQPARIDAMLGRLRAADRSSWFGETVLDQRVVAGIGNMWLAESLWEARISPWRRLGDVSEAEKGRALETAARLMTAALEGSRPRGRNVYRRAGRPCPRCEMPIRSRGQGDANRMTYWCPSCQVGEEPPGA